MNRELVWALTSLIIIAAAAFQAPEILNALAALREPKHEIVHARCLDDGQIAFNNGPCLYVPKEDSCPRSDYPETTGRACIVVLTPGGGTYPAPSPGG